MVIKKMENKENSSLMHDFKESTPSTNQKFPMKIVGILIAVIIVGSLSGYGLAQTNGPKATSSDPTLEDYAAKKGEKFGSDNIKDFPDIAEGIVREGGIEGEGAYHLERPGGESQNVYMTSTLVDLEQLIGKKIKVWGATQTAQHAGWLMDVGRAEVL